MVLRAEKQQREVGHGRPCMAQGQDSSKRDLSLDPELCTTHWNRKDGKSYLTSYMFTSVTIITSGLQNYPNRLVG